MVAASSLMSLVRPGLRKSKKKAEEDEKEKLNQIEQAFHRTDIASSRILEISESGTSDPVAEVALISAGPGNAVQRHYYSNELLENAVKTGMFEGLQCYLNHQPKSEAKDLGVRNVKELVGFFSNARIQYEEVKQPTVGFNIGEQRAIVVAEFHPEPGNETALSKLREAAKYLKLYPNKPGYIGWSIVAGGMSEAKQINGQPWNVVTKFAEIDSVDMVTRAGARGRLLSFQEEHMNLGRLFGGGRRLTETQRRVKEGEEFRESVSKHVLKSLTEAGIEVEDTQAEIVTEAIASLPDKIFSPGMVLATVAEAGVEIAEDQLDKFHEAVGAGKNGALIKMIEEMPAMEADPEDDQDADDVKGKKAAAAKEDAKDGDPKGGKGKKDMDESDKKIADLEGRLATLEESNKKLTKQLESNEADSRLRNARTLLAKSTKLNEAQKKIAEEMLSEVDIKDQAKKLSIFEEAFGKEQGSGTAPVGARTRRFQEAGSRGGAGVKSFSAMKD